MVSLIFAVSEDSGRAAMVACWVVCVGESNQPLTAGLYFLRPPQGKLDDDWGVADVPAGSSLAVRLANLNMGAYV